MTNQNGLNTLLRAIINFTHFGGTFGAQNNGYTSGLRRFTIEPLTQSWRTSNMASSTASISPSSEHVENKISTTSHVKKRRRKGFLWDPNISISSRRIWRSKKRKTVVDEFESRNSVGVSSDSDDSDSDDNDDSDSFDSDSDDSESEWKIVDEDKHEDKHDVEPEFEAESRYFKRNSYDVFTLYIDLIGYQKSAFLPR